MRRALVIVALAVAAGSCGKSSTPTAPLTSAPAATPALADFSGVTVVGFNETTCTGFRWCFGVMGSPRSVELRLSQTGNAVSGLLMEYADSAIPVSGTVSADGELTLTGWRPRVETYDSGSDSGRGIETFKLRRDAGGKATGTVMLIGDFDGYFRGAPGKVTEGGAVTAAERVQPLPVQSGFAGRWRGRYLVRSCTTSSASCYRQHAGEMADFSMTLSSSGSLLSGALSNIAPVSGTSAGDTLVLSGDGPTSSSSSVRGTITSWSTYRDAAGELHGTFTYVLDAGYNRTTYEIELYFVLLDSAATAAVFK